MTANDIKALVERLNGALLGDASWVDTALMSQAGTALTALLSQVETLTLENQRLRVDATRLDFMLDNDAFTVLCNRDGSIKQYQLMTQDEDENYHVLHNERRFYNTEREAIDAGIECASRAQIDKEKP